MSENFSDKRCEPRIPLLPLHRVSFKSNLPEYEYPMALVNISTRGLGLLQGDERRLPEDGVFPGHLVIGEKGFDVKPEIVFSTDQLVGCRLTDSRPEISEAIEEYLMVELTSLYLEPTPTNLIPQNGQQISYFETRNNCDLVLIEKEDVIESFKMTFFGNIYEGGEGKELEMGQIVSGLSQMGAEGITAATKTLTALDPMMKKATLRFIDYAHALSEEQRNFLRKTIEACPVSE